MAPFYGCGSTVPRLQNHYEDTVYIFRNILHQQHLLPTIIVRKAVRGGVRSFVLGTKASINLFIRNF